MAIFGGGNTGGGLGIGIVYSLKDEFSNTADKISSKFQKMDNISASASAKIEKSMNRIKGGFASMAVGSALLAPIVIGINKYAQLSDQLADVTKTTNISGKALDELQRKIEGIDTRTSVAGLLEIAKAGGSMGIAQKDIFGFTESVDKLNVALGDQFASPELLARNLVKLRNVLHDTKTDDVANDLLHLGNVLNYMGANAAATESDIFDMANRLSGLQAIAGLSTGQIFGVATAMSEMGINAEVGGSNFSIAVQRMASDYKDFAKKIGVNANVFKDMINKDALQGFNFFAQRLVKMYPDTIGMSTALKDLGLSGARVSTLFAKYAGNIELVNKRVQDANANLTNTNSIMNEFNAKNTTLGAVFEKMGKQMNIVFTDIGKQFAPLVEKLGQKIIGLLRIISTFIKSPLGGVVVKLVAGFGALLVGVGGLVVVMNSARFMAGKAAMAFLSMGQAQIAATFANKGLIRGLIALGKQAIKTMITMGPIGWIMLAITGVVLLFVKAIQSFNDVLNGTAEPAHGFLGFLQRLGGVLKGIGMIWKSATSEGFSMTQQMHDALQKLGILDLVVSIGTWIVRVKEFFRGLGMGIKAAYVAVIKPIVRAIKTGFNFLMDMLEKWGINVRKNTSDVSQWAKIGKVVGIVIMATLVPAFIALAIAVIAATWPILVIIGVIVGIIMVIKNWSKIMDWFGEIWQNTWGWIKEKAGEFWDWMKSIPERMYNWGASIVQSIRDGIQSAWGSFKSWLTGLWDSLMKPIKDTMRFLGFNENGEVSVTQTQTVTQKQLESPVGRSISKIAATKTEAQQPIIFDKSTQTETVKNINIKLDSREIAHEVESVQEEESNRR